MNIDELIEAHNLLHIAICEKRNGKERDGILLDGLKKLEKFMGCIYELNETAEVYLEIYELNETAEVYLESDNIQQANALIRLGYAEIDPNDERKIIKRKEKTI
jgi:hypothetical protein